MKRNPSLSQLALRGLLVIAIAVSAPAREVQLASTPPLELVRRTVENEIKASHAPISYMFRDRKQTPRGSQTKLMVETRDAMAGLLVAINDQPLTPEQRQGENGRLQRLLNDPVELRRKQKQESDDSERITRIVKALPDAFLYEPDGTEPGRQGMGNPGDELVKLKFRPNPDYDPPTRVEQVLTSMQGYILIDANKDRIARIDGTLYRDVSFGWGILGHLDRGGRFLVEQGQVDKDSWEISRMDLSFTGKILLFKGIRIQSAEVYSDFRRVPENLSFAEGVELLRKEEGMLAQNHHESNGGSRDPR